MQKQRRGEKEKEKKEKGDYTRFPRHEWERN